MAWASLSGKWEKGEVGILRIFPAFIHILNNCCCYWCSASRLDKKKKKKGMSAWGPLLKQNFTLDDGGTFQKQDPRWMENLWLMSLESTDLQDKPLSSFLSLPGHWSPGPLNPTHSCPFQSSRETVSSTDGVADTVLLRIQLEEASAVHILGVLF